MRLHDTCTPLAKSNASARTAGPRSDRAMSRACGERSVDPQVVRDERQPSADRDRTSSGMGLGGPDVGSEVDEGPTADRGQVALGAVQEAGEVERERSPAGVLVPSPDRVPEVTAGEGHERHDVDHPEPGMSPQVVPQVEPGHRLDRHGPGCLLADQGQDAPVVIRVGVDVEQVAAGHGRDRRDGGLVASLADVDHALEHSDQASRPGCQGRPVRSLACRAR